MDFDIVQHAAQAIHPPMALSPPSSAQPTQTTMPIQAGVQNEYHRLTRYLPQDGRDAFIGPMPGTVSVSVADRAQCVCVGLMKVDRTQSTWSRRNVPHWQMCQWTTSP
jgi:hypothetical protein